MLTIIITRDYNSSKKCDDGTLIRFSDADWAGDRDNRHYHAQGFSL